MPVEPKPEEQSAYAAYLVQLEEATRYYAVYIRNGMLSNYIADIGPSLPSNLTITIRLLYRRFAPHKSQHPDLYDTSVLKSEAPKIAQCINDNLRHYASRQPLYTACKGDLDLGELL